jgi:hypothetical protein
MNAIVAEAVRRKARRVVGRYVRSPKNAMVKTFYADFGFEKLDERENGDSVWALSPAAYAPGAVFMTPVGPGICPAGMPVGASGGMPTGLISA